MHRRIERLVSGQAKKLALAVQPFNYLLQNNNRQLQVDSKYVDLQVGKQVWYNVPRRMRQELWLSVLHKHRGAGATAAKQFATFVKQTLPVDVDADIEKDVGRTFPSSARFATAAGKLSLQRVLRAYAVYDTEVGYCQGMNFLAGLLLTYMPNEACAFGALVVLMQERKLRDLYKTDLAQLQVYLWQFGALLPAKLGKHMEEQGTLPVLYVSSWLLTSFGSDFPLFFSSRVLDVVLTGSYPHAMIKVALAILQKCEKHLLLMADMEDIVHFLKAEVPCWSKEELQDVLSDALSEPWTADQEAVLGNELGVESVVDAVGRVSGFVKSGSRTPTKPLEGSPSPASVPESPSTTAILTAAAAQVLNTPQRGLDTAPSASPNGPSPLPPKYKAKTLSSTKSANWVARLHAQPSNGAVQSARRHTTEEALPAEHASSVSSARTSIDGAAASLEIDLLSLGDPAGEDTWQQAAGSQEGNAPVGNPLQRTSVDHLGPGQVVDQQHWESEDQPGTRQEAASAWLNRLQQHNMVPAAAPSSANNAEQHSMSSQSAVHADVLPAQMLDPFPQCQTSPSVSSLQADPSILSTFSDVASADLWHTAEASIMSSSSDLQQIDAWHDADDFGNFESGSVSDNASEAQQMPTTIHRQDANACTGADQHAQASDKLQGTGSGLEAWGSFVLSEAVVAPQTLSTEHRLKPESELNEASASGLGHNMSESVVAQQCERAAQGSASAGDAQLDSTQQKQLELFMLSMIQSETSG